jgi:formylglycine-generating enzyme required for sulfatase activity
MKVNQLIRQSKSFPFQSVQYQIPTIAEWEMAAKGNKPNANPFYRTGDVLQY